MKSIGEHLKTAREEKGYSFDQVVHDTNISKEYIHALEEDDFDFFPAEAYLIGFLRNYSEYLGLDPSKMVGIYKNFKISEEPVPMDLLLGKKKAAAAKKEKPESPVERKGLPRWLIPVLAVIVVAAGVAVVFIPSFLDKGAEAESSVEKETPAVPEQNSVPKEFFLTEETLDINVSGGDSIKVSTGSKLLTFMVNFSDEGGFISYTDPSGNPGQFVLEKGGEQLVLIGDQTGVYFSVKSISTEKATIIAQKVAVDEPQVMETTEEGGSVENTVTTADAPLSDKIVIMTETYPKAYTIDALFRGDGLFRYETDGQGRIERFYQAGERLKVDVNRNLLLWASNAGSVDLKISGQEIKIGESGQVVVRSVKWVKNNETGKYELIIVPYS
ncbi:MAG: helix-turn-helix domain-containing protein [Spirochaetales bacterium]|nr:helix-turn-helix domain-containing protein [Spirochaetales bacterium]